MDSFEDWLPSWTASSDDYMLIRFPVCSGGSDLGCAASDELSVPCSEGSFKSLSGPAQRVGNRQGRCLAGGQDQVEGPAELPLKLANLCMRCRTFVKAEQVGLCASRTSRGSVCWRLALQVGLELKLAFTLSTAVHFVLVIWTSVRGDHVLFFRVQWTKLPGVVDWEAFAKGLSTAFLAK